MPYKGGGNLNKRKGARRGQGNAQKAGVTGVAAHYVTRNKAIKKLQVSLKDFRSAQHECMPRGNAKYDEQRRRAWRASAQCR